MVVSWEKWQRQETVFSLSFFKMITILQLEFCHKYQWAKEHLGFLETLIFFLFFPSLPSCAFFLYLSESSLLVCLHKLGFTSIWPHSISNSHTVFYLCTFSPLFLKCFWNLSPNLFLVIKKAEFSFFFKNMYKEAL